MKTLEKLPKHKESQATRARKKRQFSLSASAYTKARSLAAAQTKGNMSQLVEKLLMGRR